MTYTAQEAIEQMRAAVLAASHDLDAALQRLGDAHEMLEERLGERLEEQLFRPVRRASAEARKAYASLAGSAEREAPPVRGAPSHGAKAFVEEAVEAVRRADAAIAELQDSMLPVEAGDAQLRARLTAVREQLAGVPSAAREFVRVLGR